MTDHPGVWVIRVSVYGGTQRIISRDEDGRDREYATYAEAERMAWECRQLLGPGWDFVPLHKAPNGTLARYPHGSKFLYNIHGS